MKRHTGINDNPCMDFLVDKVCKLDMDLYKQGLEIQQLQLENGLLKKSLKFYQSLLRIPCYGVDDICS